MTFSPEHIGAVTVLLASIGAGLRWFFPWCVRVWKERKVHRVSDGILALRSTYRAMRNLRAHCGAERAVIFSGHNCGGVPNPANKFFVSPLHWDVPECHQENIERYKDITVDLPYVEMLVALQREGTYHFKVAEEKEGVLKHIYESVGIADSMIYFLGIIENEFLFISSCSSKPFTEQQIFDMQFEIAQIKKAILSL